MHYYRIHLVVGQGHRSEAMIVDCRNDNLTLVKGLSLLLCLRDASSLIMVYTYLRTQCASVQLELFVEHRRGLTRELLYHAQAREVIRLSLGAVQWTSWNQRPSGRIREYSPVRNRVWDGCTPALSPTTDLWLSDSKSLHASDPCDLAGTTYR